MPQPLSHHGVNLSHFYPISKRNILILSTSNKNTGIDDYRRNWKHGKQTDGLTWKNFIKFQRKAEDPSSLPVQRLVNSILSKNELARNGHETYGHKSLLVSHTSEECITSLGLTIFNSPLDKIPTFPIYSPAPVTVELSCIAGDSWKKRNHTILHDLPTITCARSVYGDDVQPTKRDDSRGVCRQIVYTGSHDFLGSHNMCGGRSSRGVLKSWSR